MYYEKNNDRKITDVSDLTARVRRRNEDGETFPYKTFICKCSNCLYSFKGICSLKECCCMPERIRAHSCTFGEMLWYCFSDVRDSAFRYRLRISIERGSELKTCFMNAGHRKRFYEGVAKVRKGSDSLAAQIFLLSVSSPLWKEAKLLLEQDGFVYSALSICASELDCESFYLYQAAMTLEYGSAEIEMPDLADEEKMDFDVFRMICYALTISAYGMDAVKISEKQRGEPNHHHHKKKGGRSRE